MPSENDNQELDLIRFAYGLLLLFKRKIFLILVFVMAGLLSGFYIYTTGMKPGKDFYKQDFVLKSACENEYIYDVTRSLAVKIVSTKQENITSLRNIEPKLILNALKESRLVISISAFDSAAMPQLLSAFHKELINHEGLNKEHEKQREVMSAFLKELKLMADSICKSENTITEKCLAILEKQSEIKTQLQNDAVFEINMVDNAPVFISQHRERSMLLAGLSVIGLLAGLMVSFLSESYQSAKKKTS